MAAEATEARAARRWATAMLALTLGPIVVLPCWAPSGDHAAPAGMGLLLFVGSSVHVASTGWFYSVGEVRTFMRQRWRRFVAAPAAFVVLGCVVAATQPPRVTGAVVLALLGWQFVHFQKQNLGVAALAARSQGAAAPTRDERRALVLASVGAALGLVGHPQLGQVAHAPQLGILFPAGAAVFATAVVGGAMLLIRRPAEQRPTAYAVAYGTSLLFFAPLWLFASPYAAVAGLTVAHGLQYLFLVGLVARGGRSGRARVVSVVVLVDIAVLAGLALNRMSHLHGGDVPERALYGVFLGLTAAHFVADAGLWRMRDAFPRRFLSRRLPYLLAPGADTNTPVG